MKDFFTFDINLFGTHCNLQVFTYKNKQSLYDYFEGKLVGRDLPDNFFLQVGKDNYVVFTESDYDKPVVYMHEFLHAVIHILESRWEIKDEECSCYLLGYLAATYIEFLEIYKRLENDIT